MGNLLHFAIVIFCCYYSYHPCLAKPRYNYAVQVNPVVFVTHPQSRLTEDGRNISLNCQANVSQVVNKDVPLPTISWRYKGSLLIRNKRRIITTNQSIGYSELVIINVSTGSDTGMYDCIASDADGRYITVSDPAHITVLPSAGIIYNLSVILYQPVLLDCKVSPAKQVKGWFFRDTLLASDEDVWILSNGSLIIFNMTSDNEGVWHCMVEGIVKAVSYHIQVISGYYMDQPAILIDANTTDLQLGDSLSLICLTISVEAIQITWFYSNNSIFLGLNSTTSDSDELILDHVTSNNIGFYMCQVILIDGTEMSSPLFQLSIKTPPSILHHMSSQDVYLPHTNRNFHLNCSAVGNPLPQITWYRNGEMLTNTGGQVTLSASQFSLFAIYQCVAQNELGRESMLIRILIKELSNPLGNLTVQSNIVQGQTVSLLISWTPPIQRGGTNSLVYNIDVYYIHFIYKISSIINYSEGSNSITYSMAGKEPHTYYVDVEVSRSVVGKSVSDVCVDTVLPYYLRETPPSYFTCSNGNVSVQWNPPTPSLSSHPLHYVTINATCLYGQDIITYEYFEEELSKVFEEEDILFGLPNGTVCQFYGQYRIPASGRCPGERHLSTQYQRIPSTTCEVSVNTLKEELQLKFSATNNNAVSIFWKIDKDFLCSLFSIYTKPMTLNITGICFNRGQLNQYNEYIAITDTILGGWVTFSNISDGSICSFVSRIDGVNVSSSPIQQIVSNLIPDAYLSIPGTTDLEVVCDEIRESYISSISISLSLSPVPSITSDDVTSTGVPLILTQFVVAFTTIISFLILSMIILIMVLCLRQRKKRLIFEVFNEESNYHHHLTSFHIKWNGGDNISIKTEIQCPYYEPLQETADKTNLPPEILFPDVNNSHDNGSQNYNSATLLRTKSMSSIHYDEKCPPSSEVVFDTHSSQRNNKSYSLRVGDNGFTFQVDNHTQDISACSSGYGSEITTSSSTPYQDYHTSLEPDLAAVEEVKKLDNYSVSIPRTLMRIESCPSLFPSEEEDTDERNLNETSLTSIPCSSNGTLSYEGVSYSTGEKFSNIDEKGYIRFKYSHEQVIKSYD